MSPPGRASSTGWPTTPSATRRPTPPPSSATSSSRASTGCPPARPIRSSASRPAAMALRGACRHPSRHLVGDTRYMVDMTRFQVAEPPKLPTFVTLRQQDGLEDQIDLVDGRWPAPVVPAADADPADPPVIEVALSDASAASIGVGVGDTLAANVDGTRPAAAEHLSQARGADPDRDRRDVLGPRPRRARLVRRHEPGRGDDGRDRRAPDRLRDRRVRARGLCRPAPPRAAEPLPLDDVRRRRRSSTPAAIDALVQDLRRLGSTFATTGSVRPGTPLLRTGLLGIVERYLDQRATTEAALSVAALGPLAVAIAAVGLIGVLVVRRRRPALALARGRGASGGQLLTAQLLGGPAGHGPGGTRRAPRGARGRDRPVQRRSRRSGSSSSRLIATALLVAGDLAHRPARASRPRARRPARLPDLAAPARVRDARDRPLDRRRLAPPRARPDQRDRRPGRPGASIRSWPRRPVLIGLAVGLITIRLYPIPVRALGWWSARRRDLVPVLGLRALGRYPTAGYLPLLILMLTMAIGTLLVRHPGERGRQPGRRLVAGGRGGLPDRVGVGRPARPGPSTPGRWPGSRRWPRASPSTTRR